MSIENNIEQRIKILVSEGQILRASVQASFELDNKRFAWIASVKHIVKILCPDPHHSYRALITETEDYDKMNSMGLRWKVGNLTELLSALLVDLRMGLLSSVINQVRAEDFDNFLDHAEYYFDNGLKNESGAIAGVVFEDTIRQIAQKNSIQQKDVSLENLIASLVKSNIITQVKAKWARAAAHVRTKATHAQWDEFELEDVRKTIEFTRELILNNLDN
jgi:hypothetical protein